MRPLRRFRLFVARRPLVYWSIVALLAAATAGAIFDRISALEEDRRRWGADRTVAVATRDLVPGDVVEMGDARPERWPVALAPPAALATVDAGTIVAAPIAAGEPFVPARLGRAGTGPVASVLPPGTRGLAIPLDGPPLPVQPGDHVDVVAAALGGSGSFVARDATVVSVGDAAVVAAVNLNDVGAVVGALANGTVVLAISGDPPLPQRYRAA